MWPKKALLMIVSIPFLAVFLLSRSRPVELTTNTSARSSRLWWTAHTAKKIGASTLEECLNIFGSDIDFRNQSWNGPLMGAVT